MSGERPAAAGTAAVPDAALASGGPAEAPEAAPGSPTPAPGGPARPQDAGASGAVESADPVGGLLQVAAAQRSLEDIARLITLLQESGDPGVARDMLRAVGIARPVEDVSRLVAVLSRPPHRAEDADEMIRAAAEHRPVEEVTRLMDVLYREPSQPHCGDEAVRAAATGRPVEELVELVGRLARERRHRAAGPAQPVPDAGSMPAEAAAADTPVSSEREERQPVALAPWAGRLAALVLAVCGAAWFPLHRDGAPAQTYALAFGLSAVCLVLALLLTLRRPLPAVLGAAVVVPAALAAAQLLADRVHVAELTHALALTAAPPWVTGPLAVAASFTALAALCVRLAGERPAPRQAPRRKASAEPSAEPNLELSPEPPLAPVAERASE
ncbi:hypothetical protein [Streptomyces sp. NPDC003487]